MNVKSKTDISCFDISVNSNISDNTSKYRSSIHDYSVYMGTCQYSCDKNDNSNLLHYMHKHDFSKKSFFDEEI